MDIDGGAVAGALLAGGEGRRFGGDKLAARLDGRTLLEHALARVAPQVAAGVVVGDAGGGPALPPRWTRIPDALPGREGPLSGLVAALEWARAQGFAWIATAGGDTPFPPQDLVARLIPLAGPDVVVRAVSQGVDNPLTALWPTALATRMRHALMVQGLRSPRRFTQGLTVRTVDWESGPDALEPLFDVDRPADLARAATALSRLTP